MLDALLVPSERKVVAHEQRLDRVRLRHRRLVAAIIHRRARVSLVIAPFAASRAASGWLGASAD